MSEPHSEAEATSSNWLWNEKFLPRRKKSFSLKSSFSGSLRKKWHWKRDWWMWYAYLGTFSLFLIRCRQHVRRNKKGIILLYMKKASPMDDRRTLYDSISAAVWHGQKVNLLSSGPYLRGNNKVDAIPHLNAHWVGRLSADQPFNLTHHTALHAIRVLVALFPHKHIPTMVINTDGLLMSLCSVRCRLLPGINEMTNPMT